MNARALIVDDEEEHRKSFAKILYLKDIKYDFAENVLDARLKIREDGYDLVLLDMQMDSNTIDDGLAVLESIAKKEKPIPTIVISSAANIPEVIRRIDKFDFVRARIEKDHLRELMIIIDKRIDEILAQKSSNAPLTVAKSLDLKSIKILFLTANPQSTDRLRIDEEIRGIKQALLQSEFRSHFIIEQEWAVRVNDLQAHLLRHKPEIVHFSGHGSATSEIILENNTGESHALPARSLEQLFVILKDNIRCVVLNACFSEQQAQAIAKHIDCVIGMSKALGDQAAINFAVAFYQALGFGRDVQTAFRLGCIQIDMQNLNEQDTPKLLAIKCDPKAAVFI